MGSYILPRSFPYDTRSFQRTLRIYAAAIIALAAVGFLMLRMSAGFLPVVYILMMGAVIVLVLMLLGPVPHLRTRHSVTGDSVELRYGMGFRLTVRFKDIAFIKEQETASRPGVRVDRADGTLFVLASNRGGVRIGLREPMVVKGGAFDQIVLDVEDPQGFVSSVKERRKGQALMRRLEREGAPKKARRSAPDEEESKPLEPGPPDVPARMVRIPKSRND